MKAPLLTLRMLLRLCFVAQAVMGIWLLVSYSDSVKHVHVIVGVVFVFCLWAITALCMGYGAKRALGILSIFWGFVMVVFGLAQVNILPDQHWVTDVLHILIGIVGIGLGEVLGAAAARRIGGTGAATPAATAS